MYHPSAPSQKYYTALEVLSTERARCLAGMLVGLAWFALVPAPLLDLPGLALFLVCAWRRLDLALCVLPLTFPYWFVPKTVVGSKVFPLSEIALVCCCAIFLARGGRRVVAGSRSATGQSVGHRVSSAFRTLERWGRRLGAILVGRGGWLVLGGALIFALGGALGVLVARQTADALRAYRWEVVEPLLYLALVVWTVRGRAQARVLFWSLLGSALVVAALTYAQVGWLHVTFSPIASGNHLTPVAQSGLASRATGIIYGSGNSLGAWLERAMPLALAAAVAGRGLARRERLLALIAAAFCVPPLLWSESRGAEVGALVGCLLVVTVMAIRPIVSLVIGGGAALLLLLWKHTAILDAALHGHGDTGFVRLLIWLSALHMIRDHPILGIGPDQFQYYYSARYTRSPYWITKFNGKPTTIALDPTLSHPHNLILDLWLSTGLLGLVGMVVVLVAVAQRILRLWRASRVGPWPAALAVGAGAALLAGTVHGMVDSAYFEPDLALFFWWAVAFVIVLERTARARLHHRRLGKATAGEVASPAKNTETEPQ